MLKIFVLWPERQVPGEAKCISTYMSFTRNEPDAARGQKDLYQRFLSANVLDTPYLLSAAQHEHTALPDSQKAWHITTDGPAEYQACCGVVAPQQ